MTDKAPSVCCIMPTRSTPHPQAFKSMLVAAGKVGAPVDVPARQPRDYARNMAVQQFLSSDHTHLCFIDDDTIVPHDGIQKLLALDKDVSVGVQPLWMGSALVANVMPFPCTRDPHPCWPPWWTFDAAAEPYQIRWCGFGLVLVHRCVFDRIGWPWFVDDTGDQWGRNNVTEDIYFCRKANRAGIDIWCDPSVVCGHMKTIDLRDVLPRGAVKMVEDGCPEKYIAFPGWFPDEAEDLYQAVAKSIPPDGVAVELGVFFGRSLCYMAEALKQHGKDAVRLYGVDRFSPYGELSARLMEDLETNCRTMLGKAGVLDDVHLIVEDSAESADHFPADGVYFVYVDAAHDRASVMRDINAWLPKIAPGGIIAGDDYAGEHPGVISAVDDLFGDRVVVRGRTWAVRIGDNRNPFDG